MTNGIGGFACGTVAGLLTRRYHGLLIAALKPPVGRTLLVTKLDETAEYDHRVFPLSTNRWAGGAIDPHGYANIERFHLDGTIPVWTFACADALLKKRIWMQQGANTTLVRYDLVRASQPLKLTLKVLVNYRDHHSSTHASDWRMSIEPVEHGLRVVAFGDATPFYLLSNIADAEAAHEWYRNFDLAVERYRGLDNREDHLHAGTFTAQLEIGRPLRIALTTDPGAVLDPGTALEERQARERSLLAQWTQGLPPGLRKTPTLLWSRATRSRCGPVHCEAATSRRNRR